MPPLTSSKRDYDAFSDISDLTERSRTPSLPDKFFNADATSSSPLSSYKSDLSQPSDLDFDLPILRLPSPPNSQDAGDNMPPARKRRKVDPRQRTTQHLDLMSDAAQSEYDRQEAESLLLKAIRKRRKIVVIAGAGISVSAGIPDFRSSHGLFRSLRAEHKLKSSGKELFDASVYKDDSSTSSFHDMVCKLSHMSKNAQPSLFHGLIARLAKEGRLLRLYTQNVDGLENKLPPLTTEVPLPHKGPWPKTIQVHGGLEKMVCQKCRQISDFDEKLFEGSIPPACPDCQTRDSIRTEYAGKRSHGVGRLRPRIVLYNEHNPDDEAIGAVTAADFRTRPDCVIVVGTSMKIPAIKRITYEMCKIVRDRKEGTTVWINHDSAPVGNLEDCWDLIVRGDADEVARKAQLKAWDDDTPEVAETYTDSDVEKSRTQQGKPAIILPSPKKTITANINTPATPPMSPRPAVVSQQQQQGKIKLNLIIEVPKTTTNKSLPNPASKYKPLKNTSTFADHTKSKKKPTNAQAKRSNGAGKQPKPNHIAAFGKVTKSAVTSRTKPEPLSPHQNNPPPTKAASVAQQELLRANPTPCPDSPPGMMVATPPALADHHTSPLQVRPVSRSGDTITPPSAPKGMHNLIDL